MHYKKYKTILSPKNGMNIYRGCTHGCIYCDARSTVYGMDHDFTDIEVKEDAPLMLDAELSRKRKRVMVGTGSMCDPYCHIEKITRYTRKCLEVIYKHACGVAILTKSTMLLEDLELLKKINERAKTLVEVTITTADENICKIVEPNVATTKERVEMMKTLRDNGIESIVWFTPILPFINDTEENILKILDYCSEAGVNKILYFGSGLTLREGDREYYYNALDKHFPGLKEEYIRRYGSKYEIPSLRYRELNKLFYTECDKRGISYNIEEIFKYMETLEEKETQLSLFDMED